jgi:3-oxoacyl-[acyl-carrier-protein] synthase I
MLRWLNDWLDKSLGASSSSDAHTAHANNATPMPRLAVVARGMCCAVGHSAPAASAALNARLNHFMRSEFVDDHGEAIKASMVHGLPVWGAQRLAQLLHQVIAETMASAARHQGGQAGEPGQPGPASQVALLISGPETVRQGLPLEALQEALQEVVSPWGFHEASAVLPAGSGGVALSLRHASLLLHSRPPARPPKYVLLVGLDSLLFAGSIEQLIAQERLASSHMADGLIPAEGAGAVLLRRAADAQGLPPLLHVEAAAHAQDPWHLSGTEPQRALGLTQAVRTALEAAGTSMADLDFQLSGLTGESWCAREAALMQSRCMRKKRETYEHLVPAQFLGFCGAALPVLALAWLADVMGCSDVACPGRSALLHFADPHGDRSALVVRHPGLALNPTPTSVSTANSSERSVRAART